MSLRSSRLPLAVLGVAACVVALPAAGQHEPPLVLFVAGEASHGYGAHEFGPGGALLVDALNASGGVQAELYRNGWPEKGLPLDEAAALVLYMDGGKRHPVLAHLPELDAFARKGGGIVAMHYALEVPRGEASEAFLRWIGGYYEDGYSSNPVWPAETTIAGEHPAARGVSSLAAVDEWYFPIRFREDTDAIRPLLTATPDDEARANPTWPRSPKAHVLEASGATETLAWTTVRADGGRGVGFTGGHFHWNWGNDAFRRLVLNAIVWAAGADVPADGIASTRLTLDALEQDQDERRPWFFYDREETRARFDLETTD